MAKNKSRKENSAVEIWRIGEEWDGGVTLPEGLKGW